MMSIDRLAITGGENIFYTKGLMDVFESHLDYFRTSTRSNVVQVDPRKAVVYEGDFFGYLNDYGIEQVYHWLIMRINDLYSSSEFDGSKLIIIVPSKDEVEQIRSAYMATGVINV